MSWAAWPYLNILEQAEQAQSGATRMVREMEHKVEGEAERDGFFTVFKRKLK